MNIRTRRSLALPGEGGSWPRFASKTLEVHPTHEPERRTPIRHNPIQPTRRIGVRRSAIGFMATTRVQSLEVFPFHEPFRTSSQKRSAYGNLLEMRERT